MSLARAGALAVALLAAPRPAHADASEQVRVALIRPATADPATTAALTRIRGELVADGFEVVLVDPISATSSDSEAPPGSAASISLSLDEDAHVAELFVVDRLTNKKLTRRIDTRGAPGGQLVAVLAVRAVELLRASLLELSIGAHDAQQPTPSSPPPEAETESVASARRWAEQSLPAARPPDTAAHPPAKAKALRWGLEAGASVLSSPARVGPAVLSFARLRFAPIEPLELRVAFAGLGTSPRVSGPQNTSATVAQILTMAEVALRPWPSLRARPAFSLGAGALHVVVDGQASFPYQGTHSATWAAAFDAGAGLEVLPDPHIGIAMELHAFLATPYPTVRFLDQKSTPVASPALLGSLTLVGWL